MPDELEDIDVDARISDNLLLYEMALTSIECAEERGDELALQYDEAEARFWYKWADWWHRRKYRTPLDRAEWELEHGV